MDSDFDLLKMLGSVPAIIALVMLLINRAKVWLATSALARVPIWVLACVLSAVLTYGSYYFGLIVLAPDQTLFALLQRAIVGAAAASGFREWWGAGLSKPMGASNDSLKAIRESDKG